MQPFQYLVLAYYITAIAYIHFLVPHPQFKLGYIGFLLFASPIIAPFALTAQLMIRLMDHDAEVKIERYTVKGDDK